MKRNYQWNEPPEILIPAGMFDVVEHPLIAEILVRRGISDAQIARAFLDPQFYPPSNPGDFSDLSIAAQRIQKALQTHENIGVWGDFDVDGQTSTAVLVAALKRLGANVHYYLPVRSLESHGIRKSTLSRFLNQGIQLLITCDTGISESEAIHYAKSQGVDCIITDHHLPPAEIPPALAVINPHLLPPLHPAATLPGVGTAYFFMLGVISHLHSQVSLDDLLDLVALGCIADVAALSGETRYYTQLGLELMRSNPRPALSALFEKAEVDPLTLTQDGISHGIAPRLNAVGRMKDANEVVEFLLVEDMEAARISATRFEQLYLERKLKIDQCTQAVEQQIDSDRSLARSPVLLLSSPVWDSSVLNAVANRISDQYNRPAFILSAPPGEMARGSARAPAGYNLTDLLSEQASLLSHFGGHEAAAGFSLPQDNIIALRAALEKSAAHLMGAEPAPTPLQIDSVQPLSLFDLDLLQQIDQLAPFGAGNPAPVFVAKNLHISNLAKIGKQEEHLRLQIQDPLGEEFTIFNWNSSKEDMPQGLFDLAYSARVNRFQGETSVQFTWIDAKANSTPLTDLSPIQSALEILDYRSAPDPQAILEVLPPGEFQVWAEGKIIPAISGCHRFQISPAKTLVVWSIPPGASELQQVIQRVKPRHVILLAEHTSPADFQTFLTMLTGLLKTVLAKKGGGLSIQELAALCGHRQAAIQAGIRWLQAVGKIEITQQDGDQWMITHGSNRYDLNSDVEKDLRILLEETRAYRQWYRTAEPDQIIQAKWLNIDRKKQGQQHD